MHRIKRRPTISKTKETNGLLSWFGDRFGSYDRFAESYRMNINSSGASRLASITGALTTCLILVLMIAYSAYKLDNMA